MRGLLGYCGGFRGPLGEDLVEQETAALIKQQGRGLFSDDPDTLHGQLLSVFATCLAFIRSTTYRVLSNANPTTACETLDEWEDEFGIPRAPDSQDMAWRQRRLEARIAQGGGASLSQLTALFQEITRHPTLGEDTWVETIDVVGPKVVTWRALVPDVSIIGVVAGAHSVVAAGNVVTVTVVAGATTVAQIQADIAADPAVAAILRCEGTTTDVFAAGYAAHVARPIWLTGLAWICADASSVHYALDVFDVIVVFKTAFLAATGDWSFGPYELLWEAYNTGQRVIPAHLQIMYSEDTTYPIWP